MITIFTALYPEANELIRALSLKKDMTQNHFQVFLGNYKVKGTGFVVKGVVLFGMGVLAIFGAAVLFAAGYHFLLGKEGIGMRYVRLTGTLIFGSVPV